MKIAFSSWEFQPCIANGGIPFPPMRIKQFLAGAVLSLLGTATDASLIGSNVDCSAISVFFACHPASTIVGSSGADFGLFLISLGFEIIHIHIDSDTITISAPSGTVFTPAATDSVVLSGLDDSNGPLQGFSLALFGNVQGFDPSAISLSAHSVSVLFAGISFDFPHNPDITEPPRAVITLATAAVPEPSTLALLGVAALAMAWSWRRSDVPVHAKCSNGHQKDVRANPPPATGASCRKFNRFGELV